MQRILSGIRPTGNLHIGNYLGSLHQWVELQNEPDAECFFMVADYHALAPEKNIDLTTTTFDLLALQLAAGLEPSKVTLFLQSAIPAHNDLMRILSTLVTVAELSRMTQYKDLIQQGTELPSAALLMYPVLMAADILLYQANLVPVGDDQEQHIEMTRTFARRLNSFAGRDDAFTIPQARLTAQSRIMSLNDPAKKMSKSLPQGAIALDDEPDIIRNKIMRAVTDSGESTGKFPENLMAETPLTPENRALVYEAMTPGVRNLFILLDATTDQATVDHFLQSFAHQTLRYSDLKAALADSMVNFLTPLQEKYKSLRQDETKLREILSDGTARAKTMADQTLKEVKDLFKILEV